MACLKLPVFMPVKVTSLAFLMSVISLFSIKTGVCMKQTCKCSGNACITVNHDRVDFKTAEKTCLDRNGELMALRSETDESILDTLREDLNGDFWIGLRLPAGACSNLSAPLRGYEWTSLGLHRNFTPSFSTWKDHVKVCRPHCVSLSNDQKWTEMLCSDKSDGFLCKTNHKDSCQTQELSAPKVFKSSEGCAGGDCDHICTEVKGGYTCSCLKGYTPDSRNPKHCKMYCAEEKCPVRCDRNDKNVCYCPDGFIRNENVCEDIDECVMQQECDQVCTNTFGDFSCSCREGFILKDKFQCIRAEESELFTNNTSIVTSFVKPTAKTSTPKGSAASAGGFIWLWICIAVAVVVLICVVRFYVVKRQKSREQSFNQGPAAPVDNVEC